MSETVETGGAVTIGGEVGGGDVGGAETIAGGPGGGELGGGGITSGAEGTTSVTTLLLAIVATDGGNGGSG